MLALLACLYGGTCEVARARPLRTNEELVAGRVRDRRLLLAITSSSTWHWRLVVSVLSWPERRKGRAGVESKAVHQLAGWSIRGIYPDGCSVPRENSPVRECVLEHRECLLEDR